MRRLKHLLESFVIHKGISFILCKFSVLGCVKFSRTGFQKLSASQIVGIVFCTESQLLKNQNNNIWALKYEQSFNVDCLKTCFVQQKTLSVRVKCYKCSDLHIYRMNHRL